jgi:hypothetical protein
MVSLLENYEVLLNRLAFAERRNADMVIKGVETLIVWLFSYLLK